MAKGAAPTHDVFDKEKEVLVRTRRLVADGACKAEDIEQLLVGYQKLLRTAGRLVRVADRNEADLRAARAAAEADSEAKSLFLSTMSHEIRTPMNGVIGMIDLLRETHLDGDQAQMLDTVHASANALLYVINDILDFSKIEAGRLDLELLEFDMRRLIDDAAKILWPTARARDVDLLVTTDPRLPKNLVGDAVRIRQVLMNLLGNAIKFSASEDGSDQGKVHFDVQLQSMEGDVASILASVTDNGVGMSEEAQRELFSPFTQADSSINRRFGGTGLGLAICHNLVTLMEGEISVESELGKGARFTVRLDLRIGNASAEHDDALSGISCAIAGANSGVMNNIREHLEHLGAEVIEIDTSEDLLLGRALSPEPIWVLDRPTVAECGVDQEILAGDGGLVILDDCDAVRTNAGVTIAPIRPCPARETCMAIAAAAGRNLGEQVSRLGALEIPHRRPPDKETAILSRQLVLIAEDNRTNQDLIQRQMQRLGYAADIVDDGLAALEALSSDNYAILLTDLHMPRLDGYGLTQRVRGLEQGSDRHLPIVAITANAMSGEAQKGLAIGMDAYLTKPLDLADLYDTLRSIVGEPLGPEVEDESEMAPSLVATMSAWGDIGLELGFLSRNVGGDPEAMAKVIFDFNESSAPLVAEIVSEIDAENFEQAGGAAHSLKSAARVVGAHALASLCEDIEGMSKAPQADLPAIRAACAAMVEIWDELSPAISAHKATVSR